MDIFNYLNENLEELSLVNHIITLSHPIINPLIKKDLSTFNFTWKAIHDFYLKSLNNDQETYGNIDFKRLMYLEILDKIENVIIKKKIIRNKNYIPINRKKKKMKYFLFKKYPHNSHTKTEIVFNKWDHNKKFIPELFTYSIADLSNLAKKFILSFSPVNRLFLLMELGMLNTHH